MNLKKKRVLVLGGGSSGIAVSFFLRKKGASVFLSENGKLNETQIAELKKKKIAFENNHKDCYDKLFHLVVASPGIKGDSDILLHFRNLGIPVVSEVEIGLHYLPKKVKVIGITGTNGKSTVTAYLEHFFKSQGKKAIACGNFGIPLTSVFKMKITFDVICLELSSYQLEQTYCRRLDASILLNLQEDHLQRYGTMHEYLKAKWRIFSLTRPKSTIVCDEESFNLGLNFGLYFESENLFLFNGSENLSQTFKMDVLPHLQSNYPVALYGKMKELETHSIFYKQFYKYKAQVDLKSQTGTTLKIYNKQGKLEQNWTIKETCLKGFHNHLNLAAASLCLWGLRVDRKKILKAWSHLQGSFTGLVHRLETVPVSTTQWFNQKKHIQWINDSKATNVTGVQVALRAQNTPVRILLGGHSKGEDFTTLIPLLKEKTKAIYLFGAAAQEIQNQLKNEFTLQTHPNLKSAMVLAFKEADEGDTILLSPGCASFDEFKNFEERGSIFKEIILQRTV